MNYCLFMRQMETKFYQAFSWQLQGLFIKAYKLICLIATIPSTKFSVEQSFYFLKGIKPYLHNTMADDRLTKL